MECCLVLKRKKILPFVPVLAQIPMKQFGQAEQVAEVTAFLASQDYLTGQVIAIDGGLTMQ